MSSHSQLLVHPLEFHYSLQNRFLPQWTPIEAAQIPEPHRGLLVHTRDMTSTLERFFGDKIRIRPLSQSQQGDQYTREVILELIGSGRPIEFGASLIHLNRLPDELCEPILEARRPFGGILNEARFHYESRPVGYFQMLVDSFIATALQVDPKTLPLYGRQNRLFDSNQNALAEITEILPPLP